MENIFNGDFEYENKEELIQFIDGADRNDALKIIELSLEHANQKGSFNLLESYCIHKRN